MRDGYAHGCDYWIYVWMEGCEMGLPMVVFYLYFLVDSRESVDLSGFGL